MPSAVGDPGSPGSSSGRKKSSSSSFG